MNIFSPRINGIRPRLRAALAAAGASVIVSGLAGLRSPMPTLASAAQDIITTYAGGGVGDGGPATNAVIHPDQVAVDASGAIYITDSTMARVRVVRNGVISTFAGTGVPGEDGDSGAATAARINSDIRGIVVDAGGNVLFSDTGSGSIRRVDSHGVIATVATGLHAPAGLALDHGGNLYVAEAGLNRVVEYSGEGGGAPSVVAGTGVPGDLIVGYTADGVPATAALLTRPEGVAVDAQGNVYIADTGNDRIREVDAATKTISTVLGGGASSNMLVPDSTVLNAPQAVAVDSHGIVYVADSGNYRVLALNGGHRSVVADVPGYIPATGVALSPPGVPYTVYAAFSTGVLRTNGAADTRFVIAGSLSDATTVPQNAAATTVDLVTQALTMDRTGDLVFADSTRILRITPSGHVEVIAGTGHSPWSVGEIVTGNQKLIDPGGLPARAVNIDPISLAVAGDGAIYFGDSFTHRVLRVGADGVVRDVAGNGDGWGQAAGGDFGDLGDGGPAVGAKLFYPWHLAFDSRGNLYLADPGYDMSRTPSHDSGLVRRVDGRGIITTIAGGGPACHPANVELGFDSVPNPALDNIPATESCLFTPAGMAFDHLGNLYVAEWGGNRVRRIDQSGTITTFAGNSTPSMYGSATNQPYTLVIGDGHPATAASLNEPSDVAIDPAGDVFIADTSNQVIREIDTSGTITTVVGDPLAVFQARVASEPGADADRYDYSLLPQVGSSVPHGSQPPRGDGGPASSAYLLEPIGLAIDAAGNLYIADPADHRVRRVGGAATSHLQAASPSRPRLNHTE